MIDFGKAKRAVQKAQFKSIEHAAAAIRLTAIRSIRKGRVRKDGTRAASKPGKAPKTWDNRSRRLMKRNILYAVPKDASTGMVYVSPDNAGEPVYQTLEYGGYASVTVTQRTHIGEKRSRNHVRRPLAERSEKERAAIKSYYEQKRLARQKTISVEIQARPFLLPALLKNVPRMPELWQTQFQQHFK